MDFRNAKELLKVCQEQNLSISAVMLQRELTEGEQDPEETDRKMDRVLEIMKSAASTPIHTPVKSMGGLIGGEAKNLRSQRCRKKSLRGSSGKSCHLRDGNSGNQCFHGCDRSLPRLPDLPVSFRDFCLPSRKPMIFPMNRSSRSL